MLIYPCSECWTRCPLSCNINKLLRLNLLFQVRIQSDGVRNCWDGCRHHGRHFTSFWSSWGSFRYRSVQLFSRTDQWSHRCKRQAFRLGPKNQCCGSVNNFSDPRIRTSEVWIPGFRIRIHYFRIRIQRLRLETNTDPDPDPIRIQGFNDQKLKKKWQLKKKIKFFFGQKLQFTYP